MSELWDNDPDDDPWDCLAKLVPPQYRGRTWDYGTNQGVVHSRFPPMREGTEITEEFEEFQAHAGRVRRQQHPEDYCVGCRGVNIIAICPRCKVNWHDEASGHPTPTTATYLCRRCTRTFESSLLCVLCRRKAEGIANPYPL